MDILNEQRLTITEAAKRLDTHVRNVWRWVLKPNGVRGVRLESFLIGNRRYTSEEAVQRFVERLNAAPGEKRVSSSKARERRIAQAERELAEAGL